MKPEWGVRLYQGGWWALCYGARLVLLSKDMEALCNIRDALREAKEDVVPWMGELG